MHPPTSDSFTSGSAALPWRHASASGSTHSCVFRVLLPD